MGSMNCGLALRSEKTSIEFRSNTPTPQSQKLDPHIACDGGCGEKRFYDRNFRYSAGQVPPGWTGWWESAEKRVDYCALCWRAMQRRGFTAKIPRPGYKMREAAYLYFHRTLDDAGDDLAWIQGVAPQATDEDVQQLYILMQEALSITGPDQDTVLRQMALDCFPNIRITYAMEDWVNGLDQCPSDHVCSRYRMMLRAINGDFDDPIRDVKGIPMDEIKELK